MFSGEIMSTYSELNQAFIEEFANLEKLCNQIYNSKSGVTNYIKEMSELSLDAMLHVENWYLSIKKLKKVRHKRNSLAHGDVSFKEFYAEETDIAFLTSFRKSILSGDDPIALYRQEKDRMEREKRASETERRNITSNQNNHVVQQPLPRFDNSKNNDDSIVAILLSVMCFILIAVLIVLFVSIMNLL